jgi:hypothetical protein
MSRAARSGRWVFLLLALLCVAPRVLRFIQPADCVAGSARGQAALLLARGHEPYVRFAQPGLPVGEGALALAVRAFGPSLAVAELCNDVAVLLVAAALWVAGRRLAGPLAGGTAAVLWSWSAWVAHVNLFASASWSALGAALALAVYLDPRPLLGRRCAGLALALLLAMSVQLAAAATALALLAHLCGTGRARVALRVLLALAAGGALLLLLGRLAWGQPFLEQGFALPWKLAFAPVASGEAEPTLGGALSRLLALTDPVAAAGLVALIVVGFPRLTRPEGAVALVLVAELAVALASGAGMRAEDAIRLVPASALLAGALLAELLAGRVRAPILAAASVLVLVAVATVPVEWLPAEPGEDVPGGWFGGRPSATVAAQADFLRRCSRPDDLVATSEPWCAFAADRLEFARESPARPTSRLRLVQALTLREIALVVEPLDKLGNIFDWDLRPADYRRFTDAETGLTAWRPAQGWTHPQVRALERDPERPPERPRSRPPGPAAERAGEQP